MGLRLRVLPMCCALWAAGAPLHRACAQVLPVPDAANAAAASGSAPRRLQNMDWMTAGDNRPQPVPVSGGLYEPMDWSVLEADKPLAIDAIAPATLSQLLQSKLRPDLPRCIAAAFLDEPAQRRPFLLHLYGRLGGGQTLINLNGALRSGMALPSSSDNGLFNLMVHNFDPINRLDDWKLSAMTNPLPAYLALVVQSARRLAGTSACRVGGGRCRTYQGSIGLYWSQNGLRRKPPSESAASQPGVAVDPADAATRRAPATPASLKVVFEDPCWGTRDGFVEAYANRSRALERLHQWTH
jgi:hypothetical protein